MGMPVCGFDNFVKDGVVPKAVEGNRCELYPLGDASRFCEVFRGRMVEWGEGLRGEVLYW